ncbi:hypothetical protein [Actinacidiphila glaucinigra]
MLDMSCAHVIRGVRRGPLFIIVLSGQTRPTGNAEALWLDDLITKP